MIFSAKTLTNTIAVVFLAISLFSCSNEQNQPVFSDEGAEQENPDSEMENIFYSIPSPIELGQLLQRAGATYDTELMNPADRAEQYASSSAKAYNLGVYVADLSYTTVSGQVQESMIYISSVKKLSEGLGLKTFSSEVMLQMEQNKGNKDEMIKLVADAYQASNEALSEEERDLISTLAITGGWIEGIYLGTQLAKSSADKSGIVKMVAEQSGTLDNLISKLSQYKSNEAVTAVLDELIQIQAIYQETTVEAEAEVSTEEGSNVITIGGTSSFHLDEDQFNRISAKVESLRNYIVKL